MKKLISCFAVFVLLVMNGSVFALGSGESIFNSLSLKKRTDDPATGTGEGKIYYRGAVAGGIDSNTVLMLHMDGSDEGTVFTDDSDIPHTVTAYGDANTEDSEKKFGGTSAEFDGTGDYLSIADSDDWNFGTGAFTVDVWVYGVWSGIGENIVNHGASAGTADDVGWSLMVDHTRIDWGINDGTNHYISATGLSITDNTWHHVAVSRDSSSNLYIFHNGVLKSTTSSYTYSPDASIKDLKIGVSYNGDRYLSGYLEELRISKGIARWTSNFTPPAKSYSSSTPEGLYFKDENGTVTPIIEILP